MFKKKQAVVRTKKYGKLVRFSAVCAAVIIAAGLGAYAWQKYEENKYPQGTEKDYSLPNAFINFARLITDFIEQGDGTEVPPADDAEEQTEQNSEDTEDNIIIVGSNDPEQSSEASSEEDDPEPVIIGGIVEEGEQAGFYDFRDSLFVGDYFVAQAENLGYFEYTQYAYVTGLDMNTMLTKKVIKTEDSYVTLGDYIKTLSGIDAVYIMISAESISWMDCPTFVKKYTAFVDQVVEAQPKAQIYLQLIFPINEEKSVKRGYSVTNEKINEINEYILSLAEERSFWVLDIAGTFKDEEGELPAEYTTNGIRFERNTYELWSDYIVTHKAH